MRNTLTIAIILFLTNAINSQHSSVTSALSGDDEFSKVVENPNLKGADLYDIGKEWVYSTFVSGDHVIDIDDKEDLEIIGSAKTKELTYMNVLSPIDAGHFDYKFRLSFKDSKARIKITDLIYRRGKLVKKEGASFFEDHPHNWGKMTRKKDKKEWDKMKLQAQNEIDAIMSDFEHTISKAEEDKW